MSSELFLHPGIVEYEYELKRMCCCSSCMNHILCCSVVVTMGCTVPNIEYNENSRHQRGCMFPDICTTHCCTFLSTRAAQFLSTATAAHEQKSGRCGEAGSIALVQITMHKDNLHYGDVEHRDLHNLNGALVHMATAQGLVERGRSIFGSDGDRPFVLSRSFFAGSQRTGPIWTGDNAASWEHLRLSVPMLLSISIAGLPFAGEQQVDTTDSD